MKIERVTEGTLHVIETDGVRNLRFESGSDQPLLQFLSALASTPLGGPGGYNVMRFQKARITLRIEADEDPDYMQTL